ncbi:MAG: hypothetical protein COT88_01820 [Candidatus Colwellbacteria bacterium CG10_big_fil_rev_8_21_14_0_10_41_28]|uniref:Serine protease n=1 Tax=Candidatus Colwellbacteria bacterium CG10_big_fil_rev_8_21_14_0_10_41_28 TaxID=1974539 RepID=A0A2H0VH42_9BACT|nr:MAG: hypothetical protein COT88_01820 [Candidatus Colwellbacteria bacterium CG10_big_fil_rev_8_21_14_0_10_41_28]
MDSDKNTTWFALIVIITLASYGLYSETRKSLTETNVELQQAQEEIAKLIEEGEETIVSQKEIIALQEDELIAAEEREGVLEGALEEMREDSVSSPAGGSISGLLSDFAPSVARLVCLSNSTTESLQQGSGVLYKGNSSISNLSQYYVQTSLHVVETEDGSTSQCAIAVYPDPNNTSDYIVYKSRGHKVYDNDVDIAFLDIELNENNKRAGTFDELDKYSRDARSTKLCSVVSIGDNISVLGYPDIGGDSLTVTDGIVSGFETREGVRYIKVSAKIDRGNSGGLAIKDSGCVLGIPTFVQSQIESLGRILDLYDLLN